MAGQTNDHRGNCERRACSGSAPSHSPTLMRRPQRDTDCMLQLSPGRHFQPRAEMPVDQVTPTFLSPGSFQADWSAGHRHQYRTSFKS